MRSECGVIYVATGKKYFNEAKKSAQSIKNLSSDLPVSIFTDLDRVNSDPFDHIFEIKPSEYLYLRPIECLSKSPYEKTLFLDSDTFVYEDIRPIFDLLDRFDFAAAHAPVRTAEGEGTVHAGYSIEGVPDVFPEMNTGVLLYRNTDSCERMLEDWKRRYEDTVARVGETRSDQPALRKALYESSIQFTILPPEYNFRLPFPSYAHDSVKIFHGRIPYPKKVAPKVNSFCEPRVYVPGIGTIRQNNIVVRVLSKIQSVFFTIN
jgi:hypothetical protein